jgi:hypothetical protein
MSVLLLIPIIIPIKRINALLAAPLDGAYQCSRELPGAAFAIKLQSALFEADSSLLLGCTTIIASSVILVTVRVLKRGFDNRTK